MEKVYIDLNCDTGEGSANENELLQWVSSCNIACGGHRGDEASMRNIIELAKKHKVKLGAHPSYPDFENFGRISMDISSEALVASITEQLSTFVSLLENGKSDMHHIKAHGALYNDIAKDAELAKVFLKALEPYKEHSVIYLPCNSAIEGEALVAGFELRYEAFGDRNYMADGSLVSRREKNALIEDPQSVLEQIARIVHERDVKLPNGKRIKMLADTYCLHGDSPNALEILTYLTKNLAMYNIHIIK